MQTSFCQFNILPLAVPSLRIFHLFEIATIALIYTATLSFNVDYNQSIGSVKDIISGLFRFYLPLW